MNYYEINGKFIQAGDQILKTDMSFSSSFFNAQHIYNMPLICK